MGDLSIDIQKNIAKAEIISAAEIVELLRSGGDWDYKSSDLLGDYPDKYHHSLLQEFGNVHAGIVLAANGHPLRHTLAGAGLLQTFKQGGGNVHDAILGLTVRSDADARELTYNGFSWGDAKGDSRLVMRGWDTYHSGLH